jgi:Uma2 family endonuclease
VPELTAQEERESYQARHRLTVEEFHRMADAGVFAPDARIELLEGDLVDMPPIGPAHANALDHLTTLFAPYTDRVILRVQGPVGISLRSELIPDLLLLRRVPGGYPTTAPQPADVLLLIEVSDTTLRFDREEKIPLYGRYGVFEAWLLDLSVKQLEMYSRPGPNGYQEIRRPLADQVVSPSLLADLQVSAGSLFPG